MDAATVLEAYLYKQWNRRNREYRVELDVPCMLCLGFGSMHEVPAPRSIYSVT